MNASGRLCRTTLLLVIVLLCACGLQQSPRILGEPGSRMDVLHAHTAYTLAQTYLKRGQYTEAIVTYEQSLRQVAYFDEVARTRLRAQYGLSQEGVERELAIARSLAQKSTAVGGTSRELERLRERVLTEFYPYSRGTPTADSIGPGTQIARGTWQAARGLLPPEILEAVIDGELVILVQETTDLPPSEEYIVATLGYGDQVRLTNDGKALAGYVAGRPFPLLEMADPQAGLKAAWNLRYQDGGDRLEQWSETLMRDRQSRMRYLFSAYVARACGMYRARPQHRLPEWEQQGIVAKDYVEIFFPLAGQARRTLLLLRSHYDNALHPLRQWAMTPIGRKLTTLTYHPESSALGFTMLPEDVAGGQIAAYDWRLLATTKALVPGLVQNDQALFGGSGGGYPLDLWEVRQVYVLEVVPRSAHPPYGRKLLYVDRQTFTPFYAVIFDAHNVHWRTTFFSYGNPAFSPDNHHVRVPILLGQSWIDYHTGRTVVSLVNKARYNQTLPSALFTLSGLLQRGK